VTKLVFINFHLQPFVIIPYPASEGIVHTILQITSLKVGGLERTITQIFTLQNFYFCFLDSLHQLEVGFIQSCFPVLQALLFRILISHNGYNFFQYFLIMVPKAALRSILKLALTSLVFYKSKSGHGEIIES
jgi:hypothetical protein